MHLPLVVRKSYICLLRTYFHISVHRKWKAETAGLTSISCLWCLWFKASDTAWLVHMTVLCALYRQHTLQDFWKAQKLQFHSCQVQLRWSVKFVPRLFIFTIKFGIYLEPIALSLFFPHLKEL